jgi:N-sulfoglucosamine sulfohydrolase
VHGSSFMRDSRLADYGGAVPAELVHVPPWLPDRPGVRGVLGRFQAGIRFLDAQVGRLLAGLEETGRLDDTLVVFTTDHGIAEPLRRAKGTLYDRGCEVALLMLPPRGCPRGYACGHLLPNIDLRPTYAEAMGIGLTGPVDGRSCWDLLQGRSYVPHTRIFTERNFHGEVRGQSLDGYVDRYDPVRAVRDDRWHYLRWFDPEVKARPWRPWEVPPGGDDASDLDRALPPPSGRRQAEELYDTCADPLEMIDLAQRPECRAIKQRLADNLEAWMRATGDFVLRDEVPQRPCAPGWGEWPERR